MMTMHALTDTVWEFAIAGKIKFGDGAIDEIGYEAKRLGGTHALVVTDRGIVAAGLLNKVEEPLKKVGIKTFVFSDVQPDPSVDVAEACLEIARKEKPDIVVGFGGGSSVDIAKIVAMLMVHGGSVLDYADMPFGRGKKVSGKGLPLIAVPTTSGTGTEVSPAAILSIPDQKAKVGMSSNYLRPDVAIVDPLLAVTVPPGTTAATGMDALAHALESYTTRRYSDKPDPHGPENRPVYTGGTILTDTLAAKSIELVARFLRRAVNNGFDLEARRGMSIANLLAGMAFSNSGITAVHAIAYAVAGKYKTPHGVTVGMLLPYVMEYNASGGSERLAEVAKMMGERTEGLSLREAAEKAVLATKSLTRDIGIPQNLRVFGAKEEDIPELAKEAMKVKRLMLGNPKIMNEKSVEEILRKAL
ncbi:MAG: hydroxyacid-oxoacid transhydrogenase [Candidatus Bathyarchaeia archaeon]|jgi:alcohol dehydrogenase class IV